MTKQEKKLAELKPKFEKHKEIVEALAKSYETIKEALTKSSSALSGKDSNFKQQLKNESAAQSAIFGCIPSSKHLSDRMSSLRGHRNLSSSMASALKKYRSRHTAMSKEFDKITKIYVEEKQIFENISMEISKIEAQMTMSVERRKKRQMSRQQKK